MVASLEMSTLGPVLVNVENCVGAWSGRSDGNVHLAGNIAPAPTGLAALSVQCQVTVCNDRYMPRAAFGGAHANLEGVTVGNTYLVAQVDDCS